MVDPFPPEYLTGDEARATLQALHQRAYELRSYIRHSRDQTRKASLTRQLGNLHKAIEKIEGIA